jgi:enterochelin esterase family protein
MRATSLALLSGLAVASPVFSQAIVSPEVLPDKRVTFRLLAPDAKQVRLRWEGFEKADLQKDEKGVWSFTSQPVEPDYYAYVFEVDGCQVVDPNNWLFKHTLLTTESQLHVPGPASLPWELNDVPHGQLHRYFYHSKVGGDDREFFVYTPPGYDAKSSKRYPVLYLLHGYSDDASGWSTLGRANVILDNLIARKQAKPMIVVMPLGYGALEIIRNGWPAARKPGAWEQNLVRFQETLLNEVMPQAEKAYRILPDAGSHAVAGLSMGGAEALRVGLTTLDRFAWIGSFSAGGVGDDFATVFPGLDEKANSRLRLLWMACGREDNLFAPNQNLEQWLQSKGVHHSWNATPGAHIWPVWRRNLARFAPLLFQ